MLLDLCDIESKVAAARAPIKVDLTGGLGEIDIDMAELAAKAREEMVAEAAADDESDDDEPAPSGRCRRRRAATQRHRRRRGTTSTSIPPTWSSSSVAPSSDRTARRGPASRWRCPASCRPPACSSSPGPPVWSSGRTTRSRVGTTPQTGDLVDEGELVERYHDAVVEQVGIREFVDDGVPSTPITLRRCWCRCSWTRTSPSWCPPRPTPAAFVEFDPGAHRHRAGARQCATGRSPARRAPRSGCRAR